MSEYIINNIADLEDAVNKILTNDTKQNALNFIRNLVSIGDMIATGNNYDGRVIYKGYKICDFHISGESGGYPGPYTIWMVGDYNEEIESVPFDNRMKEIAWENVHYCTFPNCSTTSFCSERKVLFGRNFDNVCRHCTIAFTEDPNVETIECANKLVEMRKCAIDAYVATT